MVNDCIYMEKSEPRESRLPKLLSDFFFHLT